MEENRFHFDARWAVDGFFPIPSYESRRASELLRRLVFHAVSASQRLHVLDHSLSCTPDFQLEQACYEVLRTPFQMPVEGGESAIQTIDRIDLQPDGLHFSLNETYAAYLLFAGNCDEMLRRAMSFDIEAPKPLPLNETHRSIVVKALQAFHRDLITMSNCQAIYALENGQKVLPRDVFGVGELERILAVLGASTAP